MDIDDDLDDDVFVAPSTTTAPTTTSAAPTLPQPPPTRPRPSLINPDLTGSGLPAGLASSLAPKLPPAVSSPKRTKHKPEPLYIPPHVNAFGYQVRHCLAQIVHSRTFLFHPQSRLRSPRLWEGMPHHMKHHAPQEPNNNTISNTKISPPPYTPPPMLSPSRTASGLYFWNIISGPKTFTYPRRSMSHYEPKEEHVPTPTTAYEPLELEVPETDVQPHVNVGPQYQARIPAFSADRTALMRRPDKADLVFSPSTTQDVLHEDLENYLQVACTACVPGAGRNKEYAYHVLQEAGGDLTAALVKLLDPHPTLPAGHPLVGYQYPETDRWSQEQVQQYHDALVKWDKDFSAVSRQVFPSAHVNCNCNPLIPLRLERNQ